MYLTYDDYLEYGGTLDESTFNNLEFEAECTINWYTFDRLKNDTTYPEALKRCMYALVDLYHKKMQITSAGQDVTTGTTTAAISSQSNDGVSISYNVMSASQSYTTLNREVKRTVDRYLYGVTNSLGHKLLYRGIYENE